MIVEEASSSGPDPENLELVLAEQEVASRASVESDCSSKGKGVVAKGSSHQATGERDEEIFTSPRDRGSATKAARIPAARNPQPPSAKAVENLVIIGKYSWLLQTPPSISLLEIWEPVHLQSLFHW